MNDAEKLVRRIKKKLDEAEKQGEKVTVVGVHLPEAEVEADPTFQNALDRLQVSDT